MVDADGTQAPEPPRPFGDPASGSTGPSDTSGAGEDSGLTGNVRSVGPDPEKIRRLVDAALAADGQAAGPATESGADPEAFADEHGTRGVYDDPPTAEIPKQEAPGSVRGRPQSPPVLRLRRRTGEKVRPARSRGIVRRPSSGSAGLAVALVLMVIFVLTAIQFVVSFVESFAGIFG